MRNLNSTNYTVEELSAPDMLEEGNKWAGNWDGFDSFVWFARDDQTDPGENYLIHQTKNRDSGLLDISNHEVLKQFKGDDYHVEQHSCWAHGYADNVVIRVFQDNDKLDMVTPCFAKFIEMINLLSDYPILSEEDYSERESEATAENVEQAGRDYLRRNDIKLKLSMAHNDTWAKYLHYWISENMPNALESCDDQGGYPNDECLTKAFVGLNAIEVWRPIIDYNYGGKNSCSMKRADRKCAIVVYLLPASGIEFVAPRKYWKRIEKWNEQNGKRSVLVNVKYRGRVYVAKASACCDGCHLELI